MNSFLKAVLVFLGAIIILFLGFYLFIHIAFNGIFTGPFYDKTDLINNFEQKEDEIYEVTNYFNSILPDSTFVDIEFENRGLSIFHVKSGDVYESNWNLEMNSNKTDSLLDVLNWEKSDLLTLKSKLDLANSISIKSGKATVIGWQRSGMGKFYYNIFPQKTDSSLFNKYNDGCTYIYYKDNVVLEYGGGAIGPQCFPSFYEEKNKEQ